MNFALKKKRFFSRGKLVAAVSLIFFILFSLGVAREIINRYQIEEKIKDLKKQTSDLEQENFSLGGLINSWSNSSRLEKEARLKLGLQKPDEKAVLILRAAPQDQTEAQLINQNIKIIGNVIIEENPETDNLSNPVKWWKYFFN